MPANPETGAKSYCAFGTSEKLCNFKDLGFDPTTNECVPLKEDDVRMLYLGDSPSALNRLDGEVISICLGGDAYPVLPLYSQDAFKNQLKRGANLWLAPLADLGLPSFEDKISFIEPAESCPASPFAKVYVVNDTLPNCKASRRGCVLYNEAAIYFRAADGLTDEVIVHEFGHLFGMDDLYVDIELRPGDPADFVTGCLKGFFATTMCHERADLGFADVVGIKNMYCAITGSETCSKPKSWRNAFFGTNLATCTSVDTETEISFQLSYDRNRALLNEVPYSGVLIENNASGSREVFIDAVNYNVPTDLYSMLHLDEKGPGSANYNWNIKESKLSEKPITCQMNPWLAKP